VKGEPDVVEVGGHIKLAAADIGNLSQDTGVSVSIFAIEQTDCVDGDARRLNDAQQIVERNLTLVVTPVTDDDERVFVAGAQLDVVQRNGDCIVESGAARGNASIQGPSQELNIVGKWGAGRQTWNDVVIEIDNEELVVWIALFSKRKTCGDYFGALRSHAAAIVDYQADGYGSIDARELGDGLRSAFFEDLKVGLIETGDKGAPIVGDGDVKQNEFNVGLYSELLIRWRRLRRVRARVRLAMNGRRCG